MLQIVIVNGHANGSLDFTENGNPGNGNSRDRPGEQVHWKADPQCNVDRIENIRIKSGPGAPPSTNIFSADPPRPQGNPRHWKGTINATAQVGQEYNYDILWVPKTGGSAKTCDPKITIRPSGGGPVPGIIGGLVALFSGIAYLIYRRQKNMRNK